MNEKVSTIIAWLDEQIGCPYIYGGTGQACTPEYRRARMDQYPEYADMIRRNCPRLMNSSITTCGGCKWAEVGVGRLAYDCAQLTRRAMEQAGIALVSGANSQWLKTAFVVKGEIKDMPRNMFSLVYREDSDGRKHHTGNYTGDGWVVHAKGHDYGVVREQLDNINKPMTHYGIPAGLYSDQELRDAGIDPSGNVPTLRRGSKGELVKSVQEYLKDESGADLKIDGIFGSETEKAVKDFQKSHGLTVDGVIGPKTWAAMGGAPEKDDFPDEPGEEPEEETVRVPVSMLRAWADTLEDMDAAIRGFTGGA